ncbi:pentatricopeptide repeat-containing protein At3g12770-like [Cryptomeria japonica]|uniref:pentatricopeptide repeat-containing protein At3g12770-like n=1 Tax=Cryptomeria japonica TaxID=3369 RepID=UPI0027DA02A0|nr:pentatricopeptide repeat-containing protein At3g12770-like [Cryptomeria japonica]
MEVELKEMREKLDESIKKFGDERATSTKLYKRVESAAAAKKKLQNQLEHETEKEKHLEEKAEDERKKCFLNLQLRQIFSFNRCVKFSGLIMRIAKLSCKHINSVKNLRAHIIVTGLALEIFIQSKLVTTYVMFGSLDDARKVFDKMSEPNASQAVHKIYKPNAFLWNVMIRECARSGLHKEALKVYCKMYEGGIQPDNFTFCAVLKASNSLVKMYAKCGEIEFARQVFDRMLVRDVVTWNAMISGCAQNGKAREALVLFDQMQQSEMKPNPVTIGSVLQACSHMGNFEKGRQIHEYVTQGGLEFNDFVGNSLIDMYAKCKKVEIARQVFDKMPTRMVVSWSAIIAAYAPNGQDKEALELFAQMQLADITPNSVTMVSVLQACAHLGDLEQGKQIYDYIIQSGLKLDIFVENSLIAMYAKCGNSELASQLFEYMSKSDLVSWNAMIAGYAETGRASEALAIFNQMQQAGVAPDSITVVSLLQACAREGNLQKGKWIHYYIILNRFDSEIFVLNSLIDMYAKCGVVESARQVFDKMSKENLVTWNAMIAGYVHNGHAKEALMLFGQMKQRNIEPDSVTMVSLLPACAHLGFLNKGKWFHDYIVQNGFEMNLPIGNSLIDMYAKCGSIVAARKLFDRMLQRDVVSWSAMICGYGMHGHVEDALELFHQMQQTGTKPNHITFVGVLSPCSHAGLLEEGWKYFDCMAQEYCITPSMEHYSCMVDLLGRCGNLVEAECFIKNMPFKPGPSVWGALLNACRIHGNIELGELAAECLFVLEPKNDTSYILLSNIYAAAGRWDDVDKLRTAMQGRGLKKRPACSLIETRGKLKLCSHSEKLETAFGFLNTRPETAIRITKILRAYVDCHDVTEFISNIIDRGKTTGDLKRFLSFQNLYSKHSISLLKTYPYNMP